MKDVLISGFFLLFLLSCANQGSISGGAKDLDPPVLVAAMPANETIQFSSSKFELQFDENIQVKSLDKNLLISPFLKNKPKIKIKPKSILVEIEDQLEENTTYTFNFGQAISDLNEGNVLSGFTYVFSTGDYIDSAKLIGKVLQAETGIEPEEGLWALLYKGTIDSLFNTQKPDYIAPVQEDGSFRFQNLAMAEYSLYALRDNNFNYFNDLPDEEIAFADSSVIINQPDNIIDKALLLFKPKPKSGFLRRAVYDQNQSIKLELSSSVPDFDVEFFPSSSTPKYKRSFGDSIRYWYGLEDQISDSLVVFFQSSPIDTLILQDSLWTNSTDTVFVLTPKHATSFNFLQPIQLQSQLPFSLSESYQNIPLLEDSLYVAGGALLIKDTLNSTRSELQFDWKFGKQYDIILEDSMFVNLYNTPSDSLSLSFTVPDRDQLSNLTIEFVKGEYSNYALVFQLIEKESVVYEISLEAEQEQITIANLLPGLYQSRILIDENGNHKWDPGDYATKKQPEKILFFPSKIELRPNWDMDVQIEL